jgi:molybdenum cofactor guanylyltransferase
MKIAGVILAGGRSSRFGSDKALAVVGGKSLLEHSIARLKPQVSGLAVNTNSHDPAFAEKGLPLIRDATLDFRGPLAGILAALEWAESAGSDAVVTVAVDTPLFPLDLVERLREADGEKIAIAESGSGLHPTFGLWPVGTKAALSTWLETRQSLRVTDFLAAQGFCKVRFETKGSLDPFYNINSPDDTGIVKALTGNIRASERG